MLNPIIDLVATALRIYGYAVIIWAVVGLLINFDIINRHQPIIARVMDILDRLIQPAIRQLRRVIPLIGGLDLSPLALILLIQFAQNALYSWFWNL